VHELAEDLKRETKRDWIAVGAPITRPGNAVHHKRDPRDAVKHHDINGTVDAPSVATGQRLFYRREAIRVVRALETAIECLAEDIKARADRPR
jgi:hypothetical protein